MTAQEINRRIAEYMGHEPKLSYDIRDTNDEGIFISFGNRYESERWLNEHKERFPVDAERHGMHIFEDKIYRNYCHDLNAVWEVEEKLKAEGKQIDYVLIISAPYEALFQAAHATARQRCEAIIKVLEGKE